MTAASSVTSPRAAFQLNVIAINPAFDPAVSGA